MSTYYNITRHAGQWALHTWYEKDGQFIDEGKSLYPTEDALRQVLDAYWPIQSMAEKMIAMYL